MLGAPTRVATPSNLNLDIVREKLKAEGFMEQWLDKAILQYRRFLYLTQQYPEHTLVPNKAIGTVWREHILYTQKYTEDCDALFGEYLHHQPAFGWNIDFTPHVQKTQELYLREFEEELPVESEAEQLIVDFIAYHNS